MILIFKPVTDITTPLLAIVAFITPAIAITLGTAGSAIGIGYAASKTTDPIVLDPDNYPTFVRTSLLAQAIIESAAIYALIVSLLLATKSV